MICSAFNLGQAVSHEKLSAREAVQYNPLSSPMVRDGYYYGFVMLASAALVAWLTNPLWAIVPVVLAAFFLWFFRDPERAIPTDPGAIVSPADGKVTEVANVAINGEKRKRISIFLNVFDVHVNRSPVAGVIRAAHYQAGKFLNAMNPACADCNEQNTITIEGEGHTFVVKQIAGLLARRIVFTKEIGDRVQRGERIGLIKFGSRTDVVLEPSAEVTVKVGDRVKGGLSILAFLSTKPSELTAAGAGAAKEGSR
jgi:phosphatidylserine decarboxylase